MGELHVAILFYLLAAVIVASAAGVAFASNILYSAFSLLGTLGGVAGLYLLLGADFVGIAQLLIYIGGILVLILFAVLLTNRIGDVRVSSGSAGMRVAAPAGAAMLALVLRVVTGTAWPTLADADVASSPGTARIGDAFLRESLLGFELASVVLLVALVGAMVIARRAAREPTQRLPIDVHDRLS